ncbi:MMS19 nucleotide excision repair protein [Balamuthia mandrillaris]
MTERQPQEGGPAQQDMLPTVRAYVDPEKSEDDHVEALNIILLAVHGGKLTLQQLIEFLGEFLPSKDETLRGRATLLLSEVLTRLPELTLDSNAIHFLCLFYCDRLQDFATLAEVLKGLSALLKNHLLSFEDQVRCFRSVTAEVVDQGYVLSLSQPSRANLMNIYDFFLSKYPQTAKDFKADFVYSFLRVLDGERDPRILLTGFKLFQHVVSLIPEFIGFAEELFEIISVYFPLSFRPKANSPAAITREDLLQALKACFGAHPAFTEYCIPFLLEKLSSTVVETKLETLQTLSYCVSCYGAQSLLGHMESIWEALVNEALTCKENEIVAEVMTTASAISGVVSEMDLIFTHTPKEDKTSSDVKTFLAPLISQCTLRLRKPDSKAAINSGKLLCSAASASVRAGEEIFKSCFPLLLSQFMSEKQATNRQALLGLINNFLSTGAYSKGQPKEKHPVLPFVSELYTPLLSELLYSSPDTTEEVRSGSAEALGQLVLHGLLNRDQVNEVLQQFTLKLLDGRALALRAQCLKSLVAIALDNEQMCLIMDTAVPVLLDALQRQHAHPMEHDSHVTTISQERFESEDGKIDATKLPTTASTMPKSRREEFILHALASFASNPSICQRLLPKLIDLALQHADELTQPIYNNNKTSPNASLLVLICGTIKEIVQLNIASASATEETTTLNETVYSILSDLAEQHCPALLGLFIQQICSSASSSSEKITLSATSNPFSPSFSSSSSPPSYASASAEKTNTVFHCAMDHCSPLFAVVTRKLKQEDHVQFVGQTVDLFLNGNLDAFDGHVMSKVSDVPSFLPFDPSSPTAQKQLIPLFTAVVGAARKQQLPCLPHVVNALLEVASSIETPSTVTVFAAQCLASILNKYSEETNELKEVYEVKLPKMVSSLTDASCDTFLRRRYLHILIYVCKGLVMRGSRFGKHLSDQMCAMLSNNPAESSEAEALLSDIATAFDIITSDMDILSKESDATIRVLWKQRYFSETLPTLLVGFKTCGQSHKPYYLVAIANLLKHIPKSILLSELPVVIPLLLQSLGTSSASLLRSTLSTVSMLLEEAPEQMAKDISSLIPQLLRLTTFDTSMHVRMEALKALAGVAGLPYAHVYPFKKQVVNELTNALDDRKRIVRQAAVRCRNCWFMLK